MNMRNITVVNVNLLEKQKVVAMLGSSSETEGSPQAGLHFYSGVG